MAFKLLEKREEIRSTTSKRSQCVVWYDFEGDIAHFTLHRDTLALAHLNVTVPVSVVLPRLSKNHT